MNSSHLLPSETLPSLFLSLPSPSPASISPTPAKVTKGWCPQADGHAVWVAVCLPGSQTYLLFSR